MFLTWSASFSLLTIPLLFFFDEVQSNGWEELAAAVYRFRWAMVAGDETQAQANQLLRDVSGPIDFSSSVSHQGAGDYSPLRSQPAVAWLGSMKHVMQRLSVPASMRLGRPLVGLMQLMHPGKHLFDPAEHDTLVLPVVFKGYLTCVVDYWSEEVQSSAALFAQVLYILSVELAWHLSRPTEPRPKILIIGFTLSILNQFEAFAKAYLAILVQRMCAAAQFATASTFNYDEAVATGSLLYAPPYKAGGFDVDITLLLATRSQGTHLAWTGHVVRNDLVYIAMSRASRRLWIFIEDLRSEVLATPRVASECGCADVAIYGQRARAACEPDADRAALDVEIEERRGKTKNQLQWVHLLHHTAPLWDHAMTEVQAKTAPPPVMQQFLVQGSVFPLPLHRGRWLADITSLFLGDAWRLSAAKEAVPTLRELMKAPGQLKKLLHENADCRDHIRSKKVWVDVLEQFSYQTYNDAEASRVCSQWASSALIMTVKAMPASINIDVRVAKFPGTVPAQLEQALAYMAYRHHTATFGGGELQVHRHKKETKDFGSRGVVTFQQCASDRPAFVVRVPKTNGEQVNALYHYAAMTLEHQS